MQKPPSPPDSFPEDSSGDSIRSHSSKHQMDGEWTILKILKWTTAFFKSKVIDSPRLTAEILLAYVLGINRIDLYLRFDQPLTRQELTAFRKAIQRRVRREPVAYITGIREFWGIDFNVTPDVLIPRPETEFLVEESMKLIPEDSPPGQFRVFDLGTGSGAVIVALAVNRTGPIYVASDISPESISVARKNAFRHHLECNICFFAGELFTPLDPLGSKFDLVVSNPPYIPSAQIALLAPEVSRYEPLRALDGGPDGLDIIRKIVKTAPAYMKNNAILMVEIGYDQKNPMSEIVQADGRYADLVYIRDYSGHDRLAKMRLK